MNKRAQGIGINIVIIAAIALLVLLIVGLVVSEGGRNLSKGTESCASQGGQCFAPGELPENPGDWERRDDLGCGEDSSDVCYRYRYGS